MDEVRPISPPPETEPPPPPTAAALPTTKAPPDREASAPHLHDYAADPHAYLRVDTAHLMDGSPPGPGGPQAPGHPPVRRIIIPLSVGCCVAQAVMTVAASNLRNTMLTSTMIPVMTFAVVFGVVMLINPALAGVGWLAGSVRPNRKSQISNQKSSWGWLTRVEVVFLFATMLVTSGVSTFGLSEQLIPTIAAPYNPEWNTPQRGWDEQVNPHLNPALYIRDTDTLLIYRHGVTLRADGRPVRVPREVDPWILHLRYYWQVLHAIPWKRWLKPLGCWLIFVAACYGMFYSLTYLVLDLWTRREKLIFPLAKLPEAILPPPLPPGEGGRYSGRVRARPEPPEAREGDRHSSNPKSQIQNLKSQIPNLKSQISPESQISNPQSPLPSSAPDLDSSHPPSHIPHPTFFSSLLPPITRRPGFWAGFLVSLAVIAWNGSGAAGFHAGLAPIPLGLLSSGFNRLAMGTFLEPLATTAYGATGFGIIFTAVGIAFLLPLEVSFSIWFYYLFTRVFILVQAKLGYIRSAADLSVDWLWAADPLAAQGGGALLLFSMVTLVRALRGYFQMAAGQPLRVWLRLCTPVVGLGISALAIGAFLVWNRIPVVWAAVIVLFLVLLTLGLMRIVAEGGIYWFQSHLSFFHLYKTFALAHFFPPALMAPLVPIYALLFLDVKTFLAPNLINAAELNELAGDAPSPTSGGGRGWRVPPPGEGVSDGGRHESPTGNGAPSGGGGGGGGWATSLRHAIRGRFFHFNLCVCLISTVAASLLVSLFLAHVQGAQNMNWWFFNTGPQRLIDDARVAATISPHLDTSTASWYGVGFLWLALTLWVRRTVFWFPHPIGYIMLMNPLMGNIWFSFFLAWMVKKAVVTYGGKATFDRVRGFFIGLVIGELIAIALGIGFALLSGLPIAGIDLNRYG